jgi:hypothetical protein
MPGSVPLVLSCTVCTVDDLNRRYSLSKDAAKAEPPASRPLSIVSWQGFGSKEGLRLDAHLAEAPALSYLTVRREGSFGGAIQAVDDNLIVLDSYDGCTCAVYLVYDAVEQSLTKIRSHPSSLSPVQPGMKLDISPSLRVLIARLPGDDGRSYALVKMAEKTMYNIQDKSTEKQDVLYMWRSRSRKWFEIRAKFPPQFKGGYVARSNMTLLPFTCGGHAFWANRSRGIMYCRVDAMLAALAPHSRPLKFGFINIPVELSTPCPISCALEMRSDMYRTIGRSGESSIKFVTIDGFVQLLNFSDCMLNVWSLSPDKDMNRWTKSFLCLGSLVAQFKNDDLPIDMVPMYPSLSAEEDDVVYFMLGEYTKCCHAHRGSKNRCNGYIPRAKNPRYHIRVDMCRGVLLSYARLPDPVSPSMAITSTSVVPCQ